MSNSGTIRPPQDALNYNAVASQINASQLLSKYDFLTIKSGKTTITGATAAFAGGGNGTGTTNIQAKANGTVSLFSTAGNGGNGTVSVTPTANGVKYFTTNGADTSTSTTVSLQGGVAKLGVKQTSTVSNQTIGNRLSNFTPTEWLVVGGIVAVGILIFFAVKK